METTGLVLIFLGSVFVLLSAIGLIKMPRFLMRLQATSKASTLGSMLILAGMSLYLASTTAMLKSLLIIFILLGVTPVATYAMARTAREQRYDHEY